MVVVVVVVVWSKVIVWIMIRLEHHGDQTEQHWDHRE